MKLFMKLDLLGFKIMRLYQKLYYKIWKLNRKLFMELKLLGFKIKELFIDKLLGAIISKYKIMMIVWKLNRLSKENVRIQN
jgi:hypothetical protein